MTTNSVKPGRIACCVPFCPRTFKCEGDCNYEIMCADHWRAIPLPMRKAFKRAQRWEVGKPYARKYPPKARWHRFEDDIERARMRLWRRCKRAAIERAMGI